MSFFDPALTIKGQPYKSFKYEKVLKEQLLIAYLSKGSISVAEIGEMTINDRKILLSTLQQAEEEKRKRYEQMKEQRRIEKLTGKKK